MVNIQNEIRYRIAFGMLKKLVFDGLLTRDEFDAAHEIVADKYCPETVYQLP